MAKLIKATTVHTWDTSPIAVEIQRENGDMGYIALEPDGRRRTVGKVAVSVSHMSPTCVNVRYSDGTQELIRK